MYYRNPVGLQPFTRTCMGYTCIRYYAREAKALKYKIGTQPLNVEVNDI